MKRTVYVYRAEYGAQNIFGDQGNATPPEERQPLETFAIAEDEVDRARELAIAETRRRYNERPEQLSVATDGSIYVTLRAIEPAPPRRPRV